MAQLPTITIDLDEIRTRAEAVSRIRLNRNTTPTDELRATLYTLARAEAQASVKGFDRT